MVSAITALLVTVVTSVTLAVTAALKVLVPVAVMVLVCPDVAVLGKVATTMNLNAAPEARAPVEVMAAPVGWPLPLSA